MSNASGYMNDHDLPYAASNEELDDSNIYQQQEQVSLGYISASDSVFLDMNSFMYTQQEMNGSVTTLGMARLPQQDPTFYRTSNSDMISSCTTSAQQHVSPVMTGNSSSASTSSSIGRCGNNINVMTPALPPPSNLSPSVSPTSTSSAPLTSVNAPLIFPHLSTTSPSFLSPLSPSVPSITNNHGATNSHNHHSFTMTSNHSDPSGYPSTVTTYQQQQYPLTPSPTFMPPSHQYDITTTTRSATYPVMTMSASAPTTMSSTRTDSQQTSSILQQSLNYQLSPQPINDNSKDHDDMSLGQQQTQSNASTTTNTELRRQIHIQLEQKRRAQIKDGFEDLRNELPSCLNKKMSKVALLHRTIQHIQHLKSTQVTILDELERLMIENDHLRKFQENFMQKQNQLKTHHNKPM